MRKAFSHIACKNLRKFSYVDISVSLLKRAKLVSNQWNKGNIFVKIFWWNEIWAIIFLKIYFFLIFAKIFIFPKVFAKICLRLDQMREAAWKMCCYCNKKNYSLREIFRKNRKSLVIFAKMWNEKGISVSNLDKINSSMNSSSNHLQKL